ncbi:MAG: hypothetical protein J6L64_04145 [Opitutales bacterium]|nr:hypothetical protein [Opitutales bacterium]
MKKNATVDADKRLEILLAGTPLEPSGDFLRRVCEACLDEMIDAKLAQMPVEPRADFADRVMAEISSGNNVVAFPRRFSAFRRAFRVSAAGVAAALAVTVGIFSLKPQATSLNEQVASVISADPELARLALPDDDFTLSELVAASELLTALNDNSSQTADFFAYYEN